MMLKGEKEKAYETASHLLEKYPDEIRIPIPEGEFSGNMEIWTGRLRPMKRYAAVSRSTL